MSSYTALPASGHTARWTTWDGADDEVTELRWENEGWTINGLVSRERVQYVLRLSASWQVRQFLLFRDLDDPDLWLATDGTATLGRDERRPPRSSSMAATTSTCRARRSPTRCRSDAYRCEVGDSTELPVVRVDVETLDARATIHRYLRLGHTSLGVRRRRGFRRVRRRQARAADRLPGRVPTSQLMRDRKNVANSSPIVGSSRARSTTALSQPSGVPVS